MTKESAIAWETEFEEALKRSKSEGKFILLDFFSPV
jgi:hypothetical protein